jgi:hypothetical protein
MLSSLSETLFIIEVLRGFLEAFKDFLVNVLASRFDRWSTRKKHKRRKKVRRTRSKRADIIRTKEIPTYLL